MSTIARRGRGVKQPVKVIGESGALDGGDVLPGFALAVKALFGR